MRATLNSVSDLIFCGTLVKMPEIVPCTFTPQPDITAYELATLMPFFHGKSMTVDYWDGLGECQRHLTRL